MVNECGAREAELRDESMVVFDAQDVF